jgi:hypothetical protein
MLKQTSKNFKALFLLQFTKELIRSSETYRKLKIKKEVHSVVKEGEAREKERGELKPKRREIKEIVKEKIKGDIKRATQLEREGIPLELATLSRPPPIRIRQRPKILRIPELRLPPTVQHIRPIPTRKEVDIGKLNPLVNDPLVRTIECNGPDEKIIVGGTMGRKYTNIILGKEEIDEIIKRFSEETKIPLQEGVFKVAFGKLIISALISNIVGSKFIIQKMTYPGFIL